MVLPYGSDDGNRVPPDEAGERVPCQRKKAITGRRYSLERRVAMALGLNRLQPEDSFRIKAAQAQVLFE